MMPSCSSEISSSRSEQSMPSDATPRISVGFSTMSEPGIYVPEGANTPTNPVLAFRAPHTTCTSSVPVSTMHTRKRSALGCWVAEITRATVKSDNFAPRSVMPSTSRPIIVNFAEISSSDASVSRCSFSQPRVNFIGAVPQARPEYLKAQSHNGASNAGPNHKMCVGQECRILASQSAQCPCRKQSLGIWPGPARNSR